MKITNQLLEIISYSDTINKAQCELLGLVYPPSDNWREIILERELGVGDINLLIMLRGKLALTEQKQIMSNYKLLSTFHNPRSSTKKVANKNRVEIYCDGACQGNPGRAGSGLAIYDSTKEEPILLYGDYNQNGTNNTAELNALFKALLIAQEYEGSGEIVILSDSKYSIDSITKWAYSWKSNGWKKKGGEIKNLDIIKLSHQLYNQIKNTITIKHVKGHSGVEGNELADRMALKAIELEATQYKKYDYSSIEDILN